MGKNYCDIFGLCYKYAASVAAARCLGGEGSGCVPRRERTVIRAIGSLSTGGELHALRQHQRHHLGADQIPFQVFDLGMGQQLPQTVSRQRPAPDHGRAPDDRAGVEDRVDSRLVQALPALVPFAFAGAACSR